MGRTCPTRVTHRSSRIPHSFSPAYESWAPNRMFKQDGQQGRRRIETGSVPWGYVEDFDESRTTLVACFNILRLSHMRWGPQPQPLQILPAESHNYRIAHKLNLLPDRNNYESNEMGLEV